MNEKLINDDLIFAEEETIQENTLGYWKILIVDDDPEIHKVTKLVLDELEFNFRKLKCFSAYSFNEAKVFFENESDIALILLDVVMEEEDTGLKFVDYVRNRIFNKEVRIILRTGYPGHAPEKKIIIDYDINDYKEKTELSSQKLTTSVIAALRAYQDIILISDLNKNLEQKVNQRTAELRKTNDKLAETLDLIKKDLHAGRKIQFKLLPCKKCSEGDFEFSRYLKPSLYLSGDFIDYFKLNDKLIGFYFADVSGHGAASAFVTVLLKSFFDHYVQKFKEGSDQTITRPSELANKLNEELINENLEKYITLFYGVIDLDEKKMNYLNAGQFPYPFLNSENLSVELISENSPVGMFKFTKYKDREMPLPDIFNIFIASDGILEIINEETLQAKQAFIQKKIDNPDITLEQLVKDFNIEHIENLPDDITFLLIKKRLKNA